MKATYFDDEVKNIVIADIKIMLTSDTESEANSIEEPPAKKSKSLYHFGKVANSSNSQSSLENEISLYVTEDLSIESVDPLHFWKLNSSRFSRLCKLSRRYLSFPASSGPVERIFSSTGKIFRADRANLSDNVFSKLAFLKCNKNYNKK